MQTIPPVSVIALPLVERSQPDLVIQGPSEPSAGGANGETDNPDARDPLLASERAREIARLIGASEDEFIIPGFPPLDTREVGDRDIIDPNRPAVRGPDPVAGQEAPEALPPLPDEVDPATGEASEETVEADAARALPGQRDAERDGDLPAEAKAKTDDAPALPTVAAKPASPGASAPDVPEPPSPGAVDIRR